MLDGRSHRIRELSALRHKRNEGRDGGQKINTKLLVGVGRKIPDEFFEGLKEGCGTGRAPRDGALRVLQAESQETRVHLHVVVKGVAIEGMVTKGTIDLSRMSRLQF